MTKYDGTDDDWVKSFGLSGIYDPLFAEQAERLYLLGATDAEVAEFFGVTRSTLQSWARKHKKFAAALRAGKDEADERVIRSLYQRAIGYTVKTGKVVMVGGKPEFFAYEEAVQPDTTAMIFWLKNRRPEEWREKSEVHYKHDAGAMSDDELAKIVAGDAKVKDKSPKPN